MMPTSHIGRTWTGHHMEDDCPCPQEPCGLVAVDRVDPACPHHALDACRTIRQAHAATECPELEEKS